jgi:hypothetical protein
MVCVGTGACSTAHTYLRVYCPCRLKVLGFPTTLKPLYGERQRDGSKPTVLKYFGHVYYIWAYVVWAWASYVLSMHALQLACVVIVEDLAVSRASSRLALDCSVKRHRLWSMVWPNSGPIHWSVFIKGPIYPYIRTHWVVKRHLIRVMDWARPNGWACKTNRPQPSSWISWFRKESRQA